MSYVVIKCGGSILNHLPEDFFKNIAKLKKNHHLNPIVVHGGGPAISAFLDKMQIETRFVNGLRVTTEPVLNVVEMVLSGSINKWITRKLSSAGAKAIGISGTDGSLLTAKQMEQHRPLGYVGEVESVNQAVLTDLVDRHFIPVISPLALNKDGQRLNVNADLAAAAIAKKMDAALWMVTNVPGVMQKGKVLPNLTAAEVQALTQEKVITGGMIPKVQAACDCVASGAKEVVIVNGMDGNSLLQLAGGEATGTKFTGNGVLMNG
ncbi:acetylglutamate kinase [Heyndrickxia acidiproducens]|uniref:acetylglutamate kinase n=1 Tax=Heyndrickxia acidiproducens TaxID=1121084 RepID=UPI000369E029|nr:acetylglutamate kinase [Heyndrickxia acidiproducens]